MPSAVQGFLLVLLAGLVLLVLAALADRRARLRAERTKVTPTREIPGLAVELSAPAYVLADQSGNRPRRRLEPAERAELDAALPTPSTTTFALRMMDEELANLAEPSAWVADHAKVIVCPEGVGNLRELLPTMERALAEEVPLLVAASGVEPDVIRTLIVNASRASLNSCAVSGAAGELGRLAVATSALPVLRADLQSGFVPHSVYGLAIRVVVDAAGTHLLAQQ